VLPTGPGSLEGPRPLFIALERGPGKVSEAPARKWWGEVKQLRKVAPLSGQ
jgi:hypothetical protein